MGNSETSDSQLVDELVRRLTDQWGFTQGADLIDEFGVGIVLQVLDEMDRKEDPDYFYNPPGFIIWRCRQLSPTPSTRTFYKPDPLAAYVKILLLFLALIVLIPFYPFWALYRWSRHRHR